MVAPSPNDVSRVGSDGFKSSFAITRGGGDVWPFSEVRLIEKLATHMRKATFTQPLCPLRREQRLESFSLLRSNCELQLVSDYPISAFDWETWFGASESAQPVVGLHTAFWFTAR